MDKRKPLTKPTDKAAPVVNKPTTSDVKKPEQKAPFTQNKNGKK